jgi:hypothetical protein
MQPEFFGRRILLLSVVVLFAVYFALALHADRSGSYFVPKGKIVTQLVRPFYKEGNATVVAPHQANKFETFGDDPKVAGDTTSPILIYEDGQLLGPAHNTFADIHNLGAGRYAHWKGIGIVFSSSDNSDPNTNGRKYWAVLP